MLIQSELRVGLCAQSRGEDSFLPGEDSFLPGGFILSCTVHLHNPEVRIVSYLCTLYLAVLYTYNCLIIMIYYMVRPESPYKKQICSTLSV